MSSKIPRESSQTGLTQKKSFETFDRINWPFTILMILYHLVALYGLTQIQQARWQTWVYMVFILVQMGAASITGSHRLWAHRSYKAKLSLRITYMIFQTTTIQGPIYHWARWHRQHHKHSDTDGDPHNPMRGFFYAHIGWLLMYDHQKFERNVKGEVDASDLEADGVVMWQYRNYYWLVALGAFAPSMLPWLMGWESYVNAFAFNAVVLAHQVHSYGAINSFAHGIAGLRPYDKFIRPSTVSFLNFVIGEGDHNYHHVFPWDYKSAEHASVWNLPAHGIRLMEWLGLAFDLKSASPDLIAKRSLRTGDGTRHQG